MRISGPIFTETAHKLSYLDRQVHYLLKFGTKRERRSLKERITKELSSNATNRLDTLHGFQVDLPDLDN